MRNRSSLSVLALAFLAASTSVVACSSSGDDSGHAAFPTDGSNVDEGAELQALDVASDEPIVEEGDVDADRANALPAAALASDEEQAADVVPLSAPPAGEHVGAITGPTTKCSGTYAGSCVCEGSSLNCEFPTAQPGRNRYLPASFIAEVEKRKLAFKDVLDAGRWEVVPGGQLYDGQGNPRGTFTSACESFTNPTGGAITEDKTRVCAMINFGQIVNMKVLGNPADTTAHTFVYAFGVTLRGGPSASGWIRLDSVVHKDELIKMGTHLPREVKTLASTSYVLKSALDWGQDPKTFTPSKLPSWSQAAVGKSSDTVKPIAGHYLLRPGNVINLIYSTPGVGGASTETFTVAHEALAFKRAKSTLARPTLIRIPIEDPKKKSMIFAYGEIDGHFGWMALSSIKKGTVAAAASSASSPGSPGTPATPIEPDACSGKPDGTYCNPTIGLFGFVCKGGMEVDGLICPSPFTHCTGASADGKSLVCDNGG